MTREQLAQHALALLRENEHYAGDARAGAPVGNSVVGSLLAIQFHVPRHLTEAAVLDALAELDAQARHAARAPKAVPEIAVPTREEIALGLDDATEHILTRSGRPPLRFVGVLLAESDGERQASREQNRWHELAVYRTEAGRYVVRIAYRTRWQGGIDQDVAEVVADAAAVGHTLEDYDPTGPVERYPVGEAYAERDARQRADVRRRYQEQVSELLASSPEFAEVVE